MDIGTSPIVGFVIRSLEAGLGPRQATIVSALENGTSLQEAIASHADKLNVELGDIDPVKLVEVIADAIIAILNECQAKANAAAFVKRVSAISLVERIRLRRALAASARTVGLSLTSVEMQAIVNGIEHAATDLTPETVREAARECADF